METSRRLLTLFGASRGWSSQDWTDSDDRVRGGKSKSHLRVDRNSATFYGHLDIDTLGGAGFASQRTTRDDQKWDLSTFDGIVLSVDPSQSDKKRYTFIVKDELPSRGPSHGRNQATIAWEYDFDLAKRQHGSRLSSDETIFIPWDDFKPTYRGKDRSPNQPLDTSSIKQMSIMMRSYFGTQKGAFRLHLKAISAAAASDKSVLDNVHEDEARSSIDSLKPPLTGEAHSSRQSRWSRLLTLCGRL